MDYYIKLAREAAEAYTNHKKIISVPSGLPPEFYKKIGGVFVSIHKGKELRGCVGTYLPTCETLGEEIIRSAISAATQDYRFSSISPEEISALNFEVSVLSEPKKIKEIRELDPRKFGVIVRSPDGRCGLLLPGLEGIENAREQLSIACQKGGIDLGREYDKLDIYCFETKKYTD